MLPQGVVFAPQGWLVCSPVPPRAGSSTPPREGSCTPPKAWRRLLSQHVVVYALTSSLQGVAAYAGVYTLATEPVCVRAEQGGVGGG